MGEVELTGTHCNENPIYVFLFWEQRGLSLNFNIHVSVSDLYSPRIGLYISSSRIGRPMVEIYKSLTDRRMNVEIGTETPIFLFWEYLFRKFGILSLQCSKRFRMGGGQLNLLRGEGHKNEKSNGRRE